jgi:hypothetical protein
MHPQLSVIIVNYNTSTIKETVSIHFKVLKRLHMKYNYRQRFERCKLQFYQKTIIRDKTYRIKKLIMVWKKQQRSRKRN